MVLTNCERSFNNSCVGSKRQLFSSETTPKQHFNSLVEKSPEPPKISPSKATKDEETEVVLERPNPRELDGYVGFSNVPNQLYRKAAKKRFEFTLMVVGESGLGKSTLINSMLLTDIYNSTDYPTRRPQKTVAVETTKCLLKENGVDLLLSMVDTPGFGDAVDNSNCWGPIVEYIESKYEDFFNSETRVTRKQIPDQRVHCCLYFIQPSGHGLKSLDIAFMKRLCNKVNIIPIIAKADTLNEDECTLFKKKILTEIAQNDINIYEFPDTLEDEESNSLKDRVPIAVVGSNVILDVAGKKVRGRKYPWGIVEVENLKHCDFIALRNMVLRTHLQDLKDVTNNVHYENYRCQKLSALCITGETPKLISNLSLLDQMDEERRKHDDKMKKMLAEMEQVFKMKVKERKQKLKNAEDELSKKHESLKKQLEEQAKGLDEKRRQFQVEQEQWEKEHQEELRWQSVKCINKQSVDCKKEKRMKGIF